MEKFAKVTDKANDPTASVVLVGDLIQGLNQWRNIQDIVRTTFKALHDVVQAQGQTIEKLELELEKRPTWTEIEETLQDYATHNHLKDNLGNLHEKFKEHHSASSTHMTGLIETVKSDIHSKLEAHKAHIESSKLRNLHVSDEVISKLEEEFNGQLDSLRQEVLSSLERKANAEDVNKSLMLKVDNNVMNDMLNQKVGLSEFENAMEGKANLTEVDQVLSRKVDMSSLVELMQQKQLGVQEIQTLVSEVLRAKTEQDQRSVENCLNMLNLKANSSDVRVLLQGKVDTEHFQEVLRNMVNRTDLNAKLEVTMESIASEVKHALLQSQREIVEVLNKKAYKIDVERELKKRAMFDQTEEALNARATVDDVKKALDTKADQRIVMQALAKKVDTSVVRDFQAKVAGIMQQLDGPNSPFDQLERLSKEVLQKADTKDLLSVVSSQELVAQLEDEVEKLKQNLETKSSLEKYNNLQTRVEQIGLKVTSELTLGRWIWNDAGMLKKDQRVPWSVQTRNTSPSKLLWTPNTETIVTVTPGTVYMLSFFCFLLLLTNSPLTIMRRTVLCGFAIIGLYEVKLGFFCDRNPAIHVLVNDEPVLATSGTRPDHSKLIGGRRKVGNSGMIIRRGQHSAGNVTGWTIVDFLALPSNAQISVTYEGSSDVQGFLDLRKM
eukprot:g2225.t1